MAANAGALRYRISAIDTSTGVIDKVKRAIMGAGGPVGGLSGRFGQLNRTMKDAPFQQFRRHVLDVGSALRDVSSPLGLIASAATVGGVARLVSQWGYFAAGLGNSAARMQTNVATLHTMQGATRLLGGSAEDLTSSFQGFRTAMTDAAGGRNNEVIGYLDMLGIRLRDSQGGVNKSREGFLQLADAIGRVRDPELQVQLMRSFGIAESLWPVIRRGAGALKQYEQEAQRYGAINERGAAAAREFSQAQTRVGLALEGVGNALAERFAPAATRALNWTAKFIADNRELATGATVLAGVLGTTLAVAVGRLALSFFGLGSRMGALAAFRMPAWLLPLLGAGAVGGLGALAGERDREDAARAARGEGPGPTLPQRLRDWLRQQGMQFEGDPPPAAAPATAAGRSVTGNVPRALPPGIGDQVRATAARHSVSPDFAEAIARNEAGTGKISPAGAIGTMQLMPGTARDLGVDPNNQEQNVDGGVRYLKELLARFGGNELAAGAGYNAGPNHPGVRHYAATGDTGRLPQETRTYLDRLQAQGIGGGERRPEQPLQNPTERPSLARLEGQQPRGEVVVRVDIGNAPSGTKATASATGGGLKVDPPRIATAMPATTAP